MIKDNDSDSEEERSDSLTSNKERILKNTSYALQTRNIPVEVIIEMTIIIPIIVD